MEKIKLYGEQKHTIYEIQKHIGVSKITLYRYANGERKLENMPTKMLLDIANFEKVEPNELYKKMNRYISMRNYRK